MSNAVSNQRQHKANFLKNGSLTTPPQSAASASNPRYGGHGAAGLSRSQSKNLGLESNNSLSTSNNINDEDTTVRYGDTIRLYSKSQYVQGGVNSGGYVGYYCKARNNRLGSNRRNGPYVAIPPFDATKQHLFMPSCFQVVDPRSLKKDGDELLYGEEVMLVDDQGMVWNNCMGPISYLGPKPRGSNGQMNLRFVQELNPYGINTILSDDSDDTNSNKKQKNDNTCVKYGDLNVKLDVVNVNRRLLKKKYTNFITNFKKDVSKLIGGYLVCDGRGYPASFSIHHAPPQVEQLTIFRPNSHLTSSTTSSGPSMQGSTPSGGVRRRSSSIANNVINNNNNNDNGNSHKTVLSTSGGPLDILGIHHTLQAHYSVPWNTAVFLEMSAVMSNEEASRQNDLQTPQGRVYRSLSSVLPPLSPLKSDTSSSSSSHTTSPSPSPSSSSSSSMERPTHCDPVCRVVLSNGGKVTLWKDQILDKTLNRPNQNGNGGDGFWIDLFDSQDDENDINFRYNKDYLNLKSLKDKKEKQLLLKQQQNLKNISGINIETNIKTNDKFRKGSLHVACCLVSDELKKNKNNLSNTTTNNNNNNGESSNNSNMKHEEEEDEEDEDEDSYHPEGLLGLCKDIVAVTFPILLRLWFTISLLHVLYLFGTHFLLPHTSPTSMVTDFDTFSQNLSSLREMLVLSMKRTSIMSRLFQPIEILILFIKTLCNKIFILLSSNDAISVLSPSFFSLLSASYIANYFGISIFDPLYHRHQNQNSDENSSEYDYDSPSSLFPLKRRRYLNNMHEDNFIHSRNFVHFNHSSKDKVEKWELTLIGWDFEKASILNERMKNLAGGGVEGGGSGKAGELGEIDPNTSMPYMPERFLLAEAGDYAKALERWRDTLAWRKMKEADLVLTKPHPNFATTKECYPHFFHEKDKLGNVVYYELPGMIDWPRIKATGLKDQFVDHVMYVQEYMWTILQPSQDDRVTLVLDLNGLNMTTVFNKEIVTIIKNIVTMTSTHYPQRSNKMIVINVPGWFGMLFNLIKPLLNEAQKAKICIFRSHEVLQGMRATIDDCCIPKEYGGSSPYAIGQSPDELGIRKQVFDNLRKHDTPLYVDEPLRNPDGSRATIDKWEFAPKTYA